jgi:hypothetical protein
MARFSEPDSGPTTSATRTTHGHETRVVVTRPLAGRRFSPRRVCRRASPCGDSRGDEPLSRRSRRGRRARTGRIETRFRACYGVESPARPGPRTSMSRARFLAGRNPSRCSRSCSVRTRCQPSRAEHLEVSGPAPTREGRCVLTKTEVRSTAARLARSRRSLSPPVRVGLPSTRPVFPSMKKSVRAFATWSASASLTAPECPA